MIHGGGLSHSYFYSRNIPLFYGNVKYFSTLNMDYSIGIPIKIKVENVLRF